MTDVEDRTDEELVELVGIYAERLSNCAFNLAQPTATLDDRARRSLDDSRRAWDEDGRSALNELASRLQRLRSLPTWEQAREQAAALCEYRRSNAAEWAEVHRRQGTRHASAAYGLAAKTARDCADWIRTMTPGDGGEP